MIRLLFGSDGIVAVPSLNGGSITDTRFAPTFAEAKVTFGTDGSITQYTTLGGSAAYADGWYYANTTGIGAYFWIRCTVNSGAVGGSGTGTWLALTADRYWYVEWVLTFAGSNTANITVQIASDSGGTNIVSSCTFDLTAGST